MSGMEALGRLLNFAPIMTGVAIRLRQYETVTFVGTDAGGVTYTITSGATSAAATDPGDILDHYYLNTATDGTAKWVKTAVTPAAAAVVSPGAISAVAITVHGTMLPDTHKYVKCTAGGGGGGLVRAIITDLNHQRKPANMDLISA